MNRNDKTLVRHSSPSRTRKVWRVALFTGLLVLLGVGASGQASLTAPSGALADEGTAVRPVPPLPRDWVWKAPEHRFDDMFRGDRDAVWPPRSPAPRGRDGPRRR